MLCCCTEIVVSGEGVGAAAATEVVELGVVGGIVTPTHLQKATNDDKVSGIKLVKRRDQSVPESDLLSLSDFPQESPNLSDSSSYVPNLEQAHFMSSRHPGVFAMVIKVMV